MSEERMHGDLAEHKHGGTKEERPIGHVLSKKPLIHTLKGSIIETIRFENEVCTQAISMSDAYAQAKEQGFKNISFQEYKRRFREIEKTHPCPSFNW